MSNLTSPDTRKFIDVEGKLYEREAIELLGSLKCVPIVYVGGKPYSIELIKERLTPQREYLTGNVVEYTTESPTLNGREESLQRRWTAIIAHIGDCSAQVGLINLKSGRVWEPDAECKLKKGLSPSGQFPITGAHELFKGVRVRRVWDTIKEWTHETNGLAHNGGH